MKRLGWRTAIVAAIGVVVLSALAVGALARGNAPSDTATTKVQVTLSDMKIRSSETAFKAGVTYRIVVTNKGAVPHELMIIKPMETGAMTMDQLDQMAIADIPASELPPGATRTVEVTLTQAYPAGALEFACHVPGHYEAGMLLPITVNPAG